MSMRIINLLLCCALLAALSLAASAAILAPDAIRISVIYPATSSPDVTLLLTNNTDTPFTLSYYSTPITRFMTASGIEVPTMVDIRRVRLELTLPAHGEKRLSLQPSSYYRLTPGELYFVTVAFNVGEADTIVATTFQYVMPSENVTFAGEWAEVKDHPGLQARLLITLLPGTRESEARLEWQNIGGDGKETIFDRADISVDVWGAQMMTPFRGLGSMSSWTWLRQQTPLTPDDQVMIKQAPAKFLRLPYAATISLPIGQYNQKDKPIPEDRIALWLDNRQYLLQRGERYIITAKASLPAGEGNQSREVELRDIRFSVPALAATAPAEAPVTISVSYHTENNGAPIQIHFTNHLTSPLIFTDDIIDGTDMFGKEAYCILSSRAPGIVPTGKKNTVVLAGQTVTFMWYPQMFQLTPGEIYNFIGRWILLDEATKKEYTVTTTFPYLAPTPYPTFTGEWTVVKERPGLQLRLRTTLTPLQPRVAVVRQHQVPPSTWVDYRNDGNEAVRIFDYPTIASRMQRSSDGQEILRLHFAITATPHIEELLLPPGAMISLPASVFDFLPVDAANDTVRYTLRIVDAAYPLAANEHYVLDGTVLLPSDDKPIAVPFACIPVVTPPAPAK